MNHYERLKVSQDAPPEVIRAAYRALAAKLHPDRQPGGGTGPDDAVHGEMAALNAAYEVLIDPKLRSEYDATLLSAPARARTQAEPSAESAASRSADSDFAPGGNGSTRVDLDWIVPRPASSGSLWPPSRRMAILGGSGVATVVLIGAGWFWQASGQHRMERALSDQYASNRSGGEGAPPVDSSAAMPAEQARTPTAVDKAVEMEIAEAMGKTGSTPDKAARHRPTPDELAKMSDEELLKVLPTLDDPDAPPVVLPPRGNRRGANNGNAGTAVASGKSSVRHPLDGKPLNLRTDTDLKEDLSMDMSRLQQPAGGNAGAKPKR